MKEIWKDVPGYESVYSASNTGKIFSKRKNRLIKGTIDRGGYVSIQLKYGGYWMQRRSRIIYRTFKQPTLTEAELIHHKDENKLNDCILNLEKTDRSNHKKLHPDIGLTTRFKKRVQVDVSKAHYLRTKGYSYQRIADLFGCAEITIRRSLKNNS